MRPDPSRRVVFDGDALDAFIVLAVAQYETSAPTVTKYLNDLYGRLVTDLSQVNLFEVFQVLALLENSIWEDPLHAANRIFRLKDRLGLN